MSTTINPNYQGLFEGYATFKCDSTVREGTLVKVAYNQTVVAAGENEEFCGVAHTVRDGLCSVQLKGFVTMTFMSGYPVLGYCQLCSTANGEGVGTGSGRDCLVVEVDTATQSCTFLL